MYGETAGCHGVQFVGDLDIETLSASGRMQQLRALQRAMRSKSRQWTPRRRKTRLRGQETRLVLWLNAGRFRLKITIQRRNPRRKKRLRRTSQENSTEDAQSQLVDMSTQAARARDMPAHGTTRGINPGSAVKRSLEQSAGTAHEGKVEGPPAKATPGRRSGLRARSNLPVDRPVGTPRDQQLTDAGPTDGPGDI
ncbi:hypothetical protein HPB51_015690 [Rhipicephalus microplus]|uniref:Uncharacterized protein n=1 Tax=Rhipicephalus microplus TaxID=6941 RepID=A0A9J6D6A7_RHIMP|nr:hypothetical protein HPB51_015690 [Rhipicephalus microplus]